MEASSVVVVSIDAGLSVSASSCVKMKGKSGALIAAASLDYTRTCCRLTFLQEGTGSLELVATLRALRRQHMDMKGQRNGSQAAMGEVRCFSLRECKPNDHRSAMFWQMQCFRS